MISDTRVVGQSIRRVDAIDKVQGKTQYTVDVVLPHMLYGRYLRSPFARAKILHIDTTRARRVPGVRAVVTGEDLPFTFGSTIQDRPFFARGEVRFVGEPVAGVAATSPQVAEEALALIDVEYEELEPVLDPERAMQPDAPLVHPDLHTYKFSEAARPVPHSNICSEYKLRRGDVEEGFREADFVYESSYTTQMVQHAYLEPHAAVAQYDASGRRLTVWVGTVSPFISRKELADSLKLPMSNIRIIVPRVGGSFGAKMYLKAEPLAVGLAMFTDGKPVKVVFDLADEFRFAVKGPTRTTIKTGVKRDGTMTARQVTSIWDTGAYADAGPRVTRNSGHTSQGPYRIPRVKIDGYCIYTNKNVAVPFRGYGVQELCWAYETHTDELASELDMDPMEFRTRNGVRPGDYTATGEEVTSTGLMQSLDKTRIAIGWEPRDGRRSPITAEHGTVCGKGVALIHKATGAPSTSSAIVKFNEDGTVTLLAGTIDQGQGSDTVLAQMVAEELGMNVEDVSISTPDTDYTPFDSSSTSSRSTYHMGNAIRMACDDVKRQVVEVGAKLLQVPVEDILLDGGALRTKQEPVKSIAVKDVVLKYFGYRGGTLLGRGVFKPSAISPDRETGQTPKMTPFWMYGAQAAEVAVDLETGKVTLLKMVAYHDVGHAINPVNCKQQLEGAVVMGASGAILEEVVLNDKGVTINPNLHDYKLYTALDTPRIEVGLVEAPQPDGPYGAKGVGEPALAATAPAIANAVYAATGIRIKDLPITPELVLEALNEARESAQASDK